MIDCAATHHVAGDYGGHLWSAYERALQAEERGECVAILGPCASACTLWLLLAKTDRLCIGFYGAFGFHAPTKDLPDRPGAQLMRDVYPDKVLAWIDQRGGLTRIVRWMVSREAAKFLPICE